MGAGPDASRAAGCPERPALKPDRREPATGIKTGSDATRGRHEPVSAVRRLLARFDRFQQRHAPLALLFAVLRKFSDDGAGSQAALIAYYGFFSLFPLLLLFTTILGFVLAGHHAAETAVEHSALRQIPIIGSAVASNSLRGSGLALAVGGVGALLSGLGVTIATQNAFNTVYAVPRKDRPSFLGLRVRSLKLLLVFGVLQLISTVAAGVVSGGLGGGLLTVAGIAFSLVLNVAMFFAVFRFMTDDSVATRELWPGIAIASVAWEVLQAVGGLYVGHVLKGAQQTYGAFATVIGLLVWLYLGARVVVYAAEINVVLTRRLWPRSLFGDPPLPADRMALAALAKTEERDGTEAVAVTFHPAEPQGTTDATRPPYAVAPEPAPGEDASAAPWPPPEPFRSGSPD
jgi:membrane protein